MALVNAIMAVRIPQNTPCLNKNRKDSYTWEFPNDAFHHAFSALHIHVYYSYEKKKFFTYFTYKRHKIRAAVTLLHTANGSPIKFPNLERH